MNSGIVNKLLTAHMKHLPPRRRLFFPHLHFFLPSFFSFFFFVLATSAVFPNKFMPIYLHFMQEKKLIGAKKKPALHDKPQNEMSRAILWQHQWQQGATQTTETLHNSNYIHVLYLFSAYFQRAHFNTLIRVYFYDKNASDVAKKLFPCQFHKPWNGSALHCNL